ncbi:hypothetical protein H4219_004853 [Mycoemilia scoparia]|uniref:Uncharacterized protein n=1 Tax=Mycoemilia scoparia TaxID=417184 RepID=A0A9W7ZW35_9FUNG|nr:hypothetical protein H4219_004853 [Mycoemilia scoparia]
MSSISLHPSSQRKETRGGDPSNAKNNKQLNSRISYQFIPTESTYFVTEIDTEKLFPCSASQNPLDLSHLQPAGDSSERISSGSKKSDDSVASVQRLHERKNSVSKRGSRIRKHKSSFSLKPLFDMSLASVNSEASSTASSSIESRFDSSSCNIHIPKAQISNGGRSFLNLESPKRKLGFVRKLKTMLSKSDLRKDNSAAAAAASNKSSSGSNSKDTGHHRSRHQRNNSHASPPPVPKLPSAVVAPNVNVLKCKQPSNRSRSTIHPEQFKQYPSPATSIMTTANGTGNGGIMNISNKYKNPSQSNNSSISSICSSKNHHHPISPTSTLSSFSIINEENYYSISPTKFSQEFCHSNNSDDHQQHQRRPSTTRGDIGKESGKVFGHWLQGMGAKYMTSSLDDSSPEPSPLPQPTPTAAEQHSRFKFPWASNNPGNNNYQSGVSGPKKGEAKVPRKRLSHVRSGLKALRSSVSTPMLRRPASRTFDQGNKGISSPPEVPVPPLPQEQHSHGSYKSSSSKHSGASTSRHNQMPNNNDAENEKKSLYRHTTRSVARSSTESCRTTLTTATTSQPPVLEISSFQPIRLSGYGDDDDNKSSTSVDDHQKDSSNYDNRHSTSTDPEGSELISPNANMLFNIADEHVNVLLNTHYHQHNRPSLALEHDDDKYLYSEPKDHLGIYNNPWTDVISNFSSSRSIPDEPVEPAKTSVSKASLHPQSQSNKNNNTSPVQTTQTTNLLLSPLTQAVWEKAMNPSFKNNNTNNNHGDDDDDDDVLESFFSTYNRASQDMSTSTLRVSTLFNQLLEKYNFTSSGSDNSSTKKSAVPNTSSLSGGSDGSLSSISSSLDHNSATLVNNNPGAKSTGGGGGGVVKQRKSVKDLELVFSTDDLLTRLPTIPPHSPPAQAQIMS